MHHTALGQIYSSLITSTKPIPHMQTLQKAHHLGIATSTPVICPDLEKSSITCSGMQTCTSHVPRASFSSAALHSVPFSTESVPLRVSTHNSSVFRFSSMSDGPYLSPYMNGWRTGSFDVSATQFQFNIQFSL